jgi:hypothetical protein
MEVEDMEVEDMELWRKGGSGSGDVGVEERMYQDSTEDPAGFEIACSVVSSNGKEP